MKPYFKILMIGNFLVATIALASDDLCRDYSVDSGQKRFAHRSRAHDKIFNEKQLLASHKQFIKENNLIFYKDITSQSYEQDNNSSTVLPNQSYKNSMTNTTASQVRRWTL